MEAEVGYWKEQLKDAAVLELPTDHARPASPSYRGGRERVEISRECSEGLRKISQREGATLFMLLMAAFKALLMRYSGKEDISIGTSIANRTRREMEGLIGFFVNTLVMRTEMRGNPSFRETIRREREVALGAYAHQEVPFEKLVEEINPERDLSRSPLFQVMLALQNAGQGGSDLRGLKVYEIEKQTGVALYDLMLELTEGREGIAGWIEYSRDLYTGETIRRMAGHYERVVEEVVRDAERRIREIELMSEAERRQIVEEWNETERTCGETRLAHELLAQQARQRGEAIAVKSEKGELSYGELDRRANQLGNYLKRSGVGQEDVVGICADRSAEMVIAISGVLKAGAAYLPIDSSYPEERVKYILEDAGVKVLLTQGEAGRQLEEWTLAAPLIDLESSWEKIERESTDSPRVEMGEDSLAYIIYTSGSTGLPKGVVVEHHGVINLANWQAHAFHLSPQSQISQFFSYSFDGAVGETFMALLNGATLVISAPDDLEPQRLVAFLSRHRINLAVFVPSVIKQLDSERVEHPEMLTIVSVGESCPVELAAEWSKRCRFVNAYGPTEYTVYSHIWEVKQGVKELGCVPIGYPIDNTKSYILDDRLNPAPPGVIGEIYLAGTGISRGYLNQPQVTADKLIPNHFFHDQRPENLGLISLESAREEIDRFKGDNGFTRWNDQWKNHSKIESVPLERMMDSVKGLDSDLIESTVLFIEKYCSDDFAYNGFNRYFQEGANDSYASCGINHDILKLLFPYRSFNGLKGMDFCFGNAEILKTLSEIGAEMRGVELSPFMVQRARENDLNVRMAKVDIPPGMFPRDCGIEEE